MAVLEGPNGVWNATRGDAVPGVGKIDSIVRWVIAGSLRLAGALYRRAKVSYVGVVITRAHREGLNGSHEPAYGTKATRSVQPPSR